MDGGRERGAILKKGGRGRKKWERMQPQRWKEVEKEVQYRRKEVMVEKKMGKNAATEMEGG
jgi:hypothetical protein